MHYPGYGRDSGNDFWVPKIASGNCHFLFILFLFPHVASSYFFKRILLIVGSEFSLLSQSILFGAYFLLIILCQNCKKIFTILAGKSYTRERIR